MYNKDFKGPHKRRQPEYDCKLSIANLTAIFSHCGDFTYRNIRIGADSTTEVFVCWIDGLVNGSDIADNVIRPLFATEVLTGASDPRSCVDAIIGGSIYSYTLRERRSMDELTSDLTHGSCALIFDELELALSFEVRSAAVRAVSEPTLEKAVKGAKDSFVETLRINTALVRRRICNPKLKLVESTVGRKSNTRLAIMFIDGVASQETVEELARRLDRVDVDALNAVGSLEEYIVDSPRSPFPQLLHTERPDRFAAYLLAGRVGILADGIPIGLVAPAGLWEFMKVTGDASLHYLVSSALAILRYISMFLCLYMPALYVSISMYHQEMMPTKLLLSIIEAKQNVPFSTAVEVLGMILAFSMLQEAGLRMPNPIGDTVSIIGVLIVGQSAVEAQVVSPIAIIVVAISGISSYTIPSQDLSYALRLCRFWLLLAAVTAGLFGVGFVTSLILLHLASLDSFGVNYTAPLSDRFVGLARLLLRPFKPNDKFRDSNLNTPDKRQQK